VRLKENLTNEDTIQFCLFEGEHRCGVILLCMHRRIPLKNDALAENKTDSRAETRQSVIRDKT